MRNMAAARLRTVGSQARSTAQSAGTSWLMRMLVHAQEIADVRWMPMHEYCKQEFIAERPALLQLVQCMEAYVAGSYTGLAGRVLSAGPNRAPQMVADGLSERGVGQDAHMPDGWENT